ncbi:hypothetical protein AVO45_02970 [Ruegeria marisrubri]|uniref:Uncharacterized protein n=1 Tax=Ruegeria marisrubri TaxID=1685379 RepID=A0A101CYX7_9RHOB|nr:hypothetical protein [Ruegeria marisrubri]KUJ85952.1 hypothetical protein AVO45_02970 [Ruegeria marisrubri]
MEEKAYWSVEIDTEYAAANSALNNYFFRGRFEMLPVYLDLEGDAETEVAEALEIEPDELGDFVGLCVSRSLRFDRADPYVDHTSWLKDWSKAGRRSPPPFTALLCALSIAAERMGADENFSPNNYYERYFELLGVKGATNQQKLKQYAKSTRQFWRALNLWLSENDYLLGRPTAKPLLSHWQYASYALSQALVRDADRRRFEGLFLAYDLTPGDPIGEAEMALLVNDWMTSHGSSGPTAWLKKLWTANELRERVVAAALDMFESWEPSAAVTPGQAKKARLQWQLGFPGFPRKRVTLALSVTRGGNAEPLRPIKPESILEDEFVLEEGEPGVQFLGPIGSINLDLLLLQSQTFMGQQSGVTYNYIAKPIVVFSRSAEGTMFREVTRASLFEEHAILCHEAWLEKVEGHLAKCARPGHAVLQSSDMPGIPRGWCILRGVEIVRSVDNAHDNFHALNPLDSTAAIACVGGLKLGHGTWHVDAKPHVEAKSEKSDGKLEILHERFGQDDEIVASSKAVGDFIELDLDQVEVAPGTNLRAVVKAGKAELAETDFSLRSADVPRPLGGKRFYHPFASGQGLSLNSETISLSPGNGLEGCTIVGRLNVEPDQSVSPQPETSSNKIPEGMAEATPEVDWNHSQDAVHQAAGSCVIRGYHYWVYEPFEKGDDRFEAKMAECKDCHVRALSRSRAVAKKNWKKSKQARYGTPVRRQTATQGAIQQEHGGSLPQTNSVSLDTVFDALCYLGQGSWHAFQRLVASVSEEPWFPRTLAADLFALGHLEMKDSILSDASDWSVPPPVMVVGLDKKARLAGFHSKLLLGKIRDALESAGAIYEVVSQPGRVTLHRWSGLAGLPLDALLEGITDPHGRSVTVAHDLGLAIARNLPSIEMAWMLGTPMHVERADALAKFDVRDARWIRAETIEGTGAYRVGLHGTRYVFRDHSGDTRQVGHRVAKILAAKSEGTRLHAYDISTGRFIAALGAEPPGLFARALVASSGALPLIEGGRLIYERVAPMIATIILKKLYEGDRTVA